MPHDSPIPTSLARALLTAGLLLLTAVAACSSGGSSADTPAEGAPAGSARFGFDADPAGGVPRGWHVAGTRSGVGGPGAGVATWAVTADASAPSPGQVLALTESSHGQGGTYNLCWTRDVSFRDGRLSVAFKAVSGEEDQGGGLIWRARDHDNYYVCRANPLEGNFRVYRVVSGVRNQLGTAAVDCAPGTWHAIEVLADGPRITCTLDGTTRLQATDDALTEAGGVGLWTKADAVTSFDDLQIDDPRTR